MTLASENEMGQADCGVQGGTHRGRLWVPVFPKVTHCPEHCGNTHPPLSESGADG